MTTDIFATLDGDNAAQETILGFRVHPAASLFPLIDGEDFDELVESIRTKGLLHPVVVDGELLIDGRNRLRAVESLKNDGVDIPIRTQQWTDNGRGIVDWIYETNMTRRHLTPDATALIAAEFFPLLMAEARQRREATQIKAGEVRSPSGRKGKEMVNTKPCSPIKRDAKAMHERSTVGKIAEKAGVSNHKARQAVELARALNDGTISREAGADVAAGRKKLSEVLPKKEPKKKAASANARTASKVLDDIRFYLAEYMQHEDYDPQTLRDELDCWFAKI